METFSNYEEKRISMKNDLDSMAPVLHGCHALHLKFLVLCCLLVCALFCVQTVANAEETSSDEANASISWDASRPTDAILQANTSTTRVAMYRLYNKYSGEHFFTSSAKERDNNVKAGWQYEKIE